MNALTQNLDIDNVKRPKATVKSYGDGLKSLSKVEL